MTASPALPSGLALAFPVVDFPRLPWMGVAPATRVERTLSVTHSLTYRYPAPVRDIVTRLRLLPPKQRGDQTLHGYETRFAPLAFSTKTITDDWTNTVLEVRHELVQHTLTLVVSLHLQTRTYYGPDGELFPYRVPASVGCPPSGVEAFLGSTSLTQTDESLRSAVGSGESSESGSTASRVWNLCQMVYREMRYTPGSTSVKTTANEAWEKRAGVCQDYAHILIGLCQNEGIPARYASGFLPGEGAMHAWVEVYCAEENGGAGVWAAIDPTHDRWVNERYVTVATGRDYADISPTSGTFFGRGPGVLSHRSRVVTTPPSRIDL